VPDCVDERAPECSKNKMCVQRLSVTKKRRASYLSQSLKINKETDETVGSAKIYTAVHICPIPRCQFAVV
jgi:hypothetical protein